MRVMAEWLGGASTTTGTEKEILKWIADQEQDEDSAKGILEWMRANAANECYVNETEPQYIRRYTLLTP